MTATWQPDPAGATAPAATEPLPLAARHSLRGQRPPAALGARRSAARHSTPGTTSPGSGQISAARPQGEAGRGGAGRGGAGRADAIAALPAGSVLVSAERSSVPA